MKCYFKILKYVLCLIGAISGLTMHGNSYPICPYPKLKKIITSTEIFVAVGTIAQEQDIFQYEPLEPGQHTCLIDVTVCTYYLDWDGWIKQCEAGMFIQ